MMTGLQKNANPREKYLGKEKRYFNVIARIIVTKKY